ncbi:hypothetical protein HHL22_17885 [Hymenobacter sp. RP-2-7]|uniref:Uncharacterized protein n=1 Tax=Hymenobacter polaris TaxID=2682546 RepID=A0A7Y0FP13_9BACT|nr:hypothetical protein [Hymenobacter polaris]NML67080.1 hypothetical protein [Hymenobacter polaris]
MKQDISFEPVAGVSVAVVPDQPTPTPGEADQAVWTVYLLNNNDFELENVLVSADGYGAQPTGEMVRTSTLRYHFEQVAPHSATAIELISPAVFHLTNQYWVSYYVAGQIFDKKFLFVPGAIDGANLSRVDLLAGQVGVLHS